MVITEKIPYGGLILAQYSSAARPASAAGWNEKRHCNAEYELHCILQGQCRLNFGKNSVELSAGQLALITPGVYHSSESDDRQLLRFSLSLSPGDRTAQKQLRALDSDSIRIYPVGASLEFLCREFMKELASGGTTGSMVLSSLLHVIAVYFLRLLQISGEASRLPVQDDRSQRNGIIDTFFQTQYAEPRGEEILAARLGLSKRQLVRVLYDNYGQSFREKQTAARMDQAAVLLQKSGLSIAGISAAAGYTSETAFFRQFRNYYRMTPGQYRQSCGSGQASSDSRLLRRKPD